MKSESPDASLGSGTSIGGKFGDDTALPNGAAIDQKVGETVSDTSFTSSTGKSIGGSNHGFSGNGALKNAKTSDVSSDDGKARDVHDPQSLSRLSASETEVRRVAEINGPANKRAALICDFYAKGWCIKGTQCRFLHVRDHKKSDLPQLEGLREGSQGLGSPRARDPLAASLRNESSDNIFPEAPKSTFVPREEKRLSSLSRSVEELPRPQQKRPFSYANSIPSDLPGSSSSGALSAVGVLSSNGISTWKGSSLQFSSSLLHGPSQILGPKPDKPPLTKRKVSSDDWEPSVPFRPSLLIRSIISIPESQYDPLQDSIELPNVGKVFGSQGSSVVNTSNHQNNGDTMSVSSHNAHQFEVVGTTSNPRREKHGLRDGLRVKMENDVVEEIVNKESKAVRQFRVALIEFVKELLKPKWREGHISKETHNKIVRKAVEKVISTLPEEQVPTTTEMAKQYLALSRAKIDKLIEGYAVIYGKGS